MPRPCRSISPFGRAVMRTPRRSMALSLLALLLGGTLLLLPASSAFGQAAPDAQADEAAEASAEPAADLSQGVPMEPEADLAQPDEPPAAAPEPEAPQADEEAPPPASAEPGADLSEGAPPASAEPGADLSQGAPPEETGAPEPGPAPAEASVTVDGQGSLVSRPFGLGGGNYAVSWSAQTSSPECSLNATLHAADDGRPVQPLGSGQVFGGAASGQASLHDLPSASYYVDAISTCRWSITITPAP
jgi:hypothetical protein